MGGIKVSEVDSRIENGKKLVKDVIDNKDGTYSIKNKTYIITDKKCSCPDYFMRKSICKHIYAVVFYKLENQVVKTANIKLDDLLQFMKEHKHIVNDLVLYERFGAEIINNAEDSNVLIRKGSFLIMI